MPVPFEALLPFGIMIGMFAIAGGIEEQSTVLTQQVALQQRKHFRMKAKDTGTTWITGRDK